jgi:hypothetical protein
VALACAIGVGAVACSAVLGFPDLTLATGDDAGDSGSLANDATSGHDASDAGGMVDGPTGDAATEAGCGDTMMSATNCGRCGHSCLGGTCSAGVCQPFILVTAPAPDLLGRPVDLAVDDKRVYVAQYLDDKVASYDKNDGGLSVLYTSMAGGPEALTKDDASVYYSETNGVTNLQNIYSCHLGGCAGNPPALVQAALCVSLVIRGSSLFYDEHDLGHINTVDINDGGVQALLPPDSGLTPRTLWVDGQYVYFTDDTNGSVRRIPASGGPPELVATSGPSYGIAISDAGIFFGVNDTTAGVSNIYRVDNAQAVDGAAPPAFAAADGPYGIAIDDTNVYWVNAGNDMQPTGTVMTCPLTGCPASGPITLAGGQFGPERIALDDVAVYWSESGGFPGDGRVWKVAKP